MKLPEKLRDINKLEAAIAEASAIAASKGVPLTIERLAVVVGCSRNDLGDVINGRKTTINGNEIASDVVCALKKAVDISVAEVMEHGFIRGNSPIMPIFNLKCNHGYDDKPQSGANNNVTVIISDKNIPD